MPKGENNENYFSGEILSFRCSIRLESRFFCGNHKRFSGYSNADNMPSISRYIKKYFRLIYPLSFGITGHNMFMLYLYIIFVPLKYSVRKHYDIIEF